MSYAFKLYRLQQIDTSIDQARIRVSEIDKILSDDNLVRIHQEQVNKILGTLHQLQSVFHQIEHEVESLLSKIKQSETSLYGGKIQNPKELQDLHNEVIALKKYLNSLEDRQLEVMMNLEEMEKDYNNALGELEKTKSQYEEKQKTLREQKQKLIAMIERQEQERLTISAGIPPEHLEIYQQIRTQKNGVAVVRISDNSCSACGSTLSSSALQAVRFSNQITRCHSCGRILYAG